MVACKLAAAQQAAVLLQYGSQTVPMTGDLEKLLAFKTAKGMHLLGFIENDPAAPIVPRHHFMSVSHSCFERSCCIGAYLDQSCKALATGTLQLGQGSMRCSSGQVRVENNVRRMCGLSRQTRWTSGRRRRWPRS